MPQHFRRFMRLLAVAGLAVLMPAAAPADDANAGKVRISDQTPAEEGIEPVAFLHEDWQYDANGYCDYGCPTEPEYNFTGKPKKSFRTRCRQTSASWYGYHDRYYVHGTCDDAFVARNHANSIGLHNYLLCKFGYFVPTGCGGAGCPPVGHYSRVYAQTPLYHDGRDGELYAAQGYGVPMAVPLAPVVGHTYNYGWGVPSSRLTPVSHVAPY